MLIEDKLLGWRPRWHAGGDMSLRSKLTVGLGFLFIIIFAIAIYSSFQIEKLSKEASSILKDNYESLVYCKNMLFALDEMNATVGNRIFGSESNKATSYNSDLFGRSKSSFDSNLNAEKNNITEVHEGEYVVELSDNYARYLMLCIQINEKGGNSMEYLSDFLPAYFALRQSIDKTNDVNMQGVERKSQSTGHDADYMITSMAAIGAICILLAFFYFWYFPFFVSNTISYLTNKMKELLQKLGMKLDTKTGDEAFVLLQSINLLENALVRIKTPQKRK
jgi:hypothetical protein